MPKDQLQATTINPKQTPLPSSSNSTQEKLRTQQDNKPSFSNEDSTNPTVMMEKILESLENKQISSNAKGEEQSLSGMKKSEDKAHFMRYILEMLEDEYSTTDYQQEDYDTIETYMDIDPVKVAVVPLEEPTGSDKGLEVTE